MNFDVSLVVHESKPILGRRTCKCTCSLVLFSQRVAFGRSKRKPCHLIYHSWNPLVVACFSAMMSRWHMLQCTFCELYGITFCESCFRVTSVLGYVPQELTGTSIYEYCHKDSVHSFAELHRQGKTYLLDIHVHVSCMYDCANLIIEHGRFQLI